MSFANTMDSNDAFVNLDEVGDILALMRRQEVTTYQRSDYLTLDPKLSLRVVDGSWRQKIIEWMYGVIDHCSLRRDSVAVATHYLDLCVEKRLITSRHEFQLAAMTALQLAIKMYDSTMVKLDSLVKLGRGQFKEEDVVEMEKKMLDALQWQVHPPTPVCFLRQFLRLLPSTVAPMSRYMLAEVTRFISEVSVCLYKFVKYPPSSVAYAGMLIAIDRIDEVMLPMWQRKEILHVLSHVAKLDLSSPDILEIVEHLQHSLEKNVSLQELMKTIDAQCHDSYTKMRSGSSDYSQQQILLRSGGEHSPRDVTNPLS
jgi:Cyclin, N-terminal domain/Cyclin, C-terminal domain